MCLSACLLARAMQDVHGLSWQELDAIFMQGTIDEGSESHYSATRLHRAIAAALGQ